ncbi:hypothetical protein ABK040_001118 [Willaertia magna]
MITNNSDNVSSSTTTREAPLSGKTTTAPPMKVISVASSPPVIHQLPQEIQQQIKSGTTIQHLTDCLKELIENAIDAKATNIEIYLKNSGYDSIIIKDNGTGIPKENFNFICKRYYTSKFNFQSPSAPLLEKKNNENVDNNTMITEEEDKNEEENQEEHKLNELFYGYKGEALNSICHLSKSLQIKTKCSSSNEVFGNNLTFDNSGNLVNQNEVQSLDGTMITIYELFSTYPVRRKFFKNNLKKQLNQFLQFLKQISFIHWNIRFFCKDDDKVLFTKVGNIPNWKVSFLTIFGNNNYFDNFYFYESDHSDKYKLSIFVPKLTTVFVNNDNNQQFSSSFIDSSKEEICKFLTSTKPYIYINQRVIYEYKEMIKTMKSIFERYFKKGNLFYILHIHFKSTNFYDINLNPNKTKIITNLNTEIEKDLQSHLINYYMEEYRNIHENNEDNNLIPLIRDKNDELVDNVLNDSIISTKKNASSILLSGKESNNNSPSILKVGLTNSNNNNSTVTTSPNSNQQLIMKATPEERRGVNVYANPFVNKRSISPVSTVNNNKKDDMAEENNENLMNEDNALLNNDIGGVNNNNDMEDDGQQFKTPQRNMRFPTSSSSAPFSTPNSSNSNFSRSSTSSSVSSSRSISLGFSGLGLGASPSPIKKPTNMIDEDEDELIEKANNNTITDKTKVNEGKEPIVVNEMDDNEEEQQQTNKTNKRITLTHPSGSSNNKNKSSPPNLDIYKYKPTTNTNTNLNKKRKTLQTTILDLMKSKNKEDEEEDDIVVNNVTDSFITKKRKVIEKTKDFQIHPLHFITDKEINQEYKFYKKDLKENEYISTIGKVTFNFGIIYNLNYQTLFIVNLIQMKKDSLFYTLRNTYDLSINIVPLQQPINLLMIKEISSKTYKAICVKKEYQFLFEKNGFKLSSEMQTLENEPKKKKIVKLELVGIVNSSVFGSSEISKYGLNECIELIKKIESFEKETLSTNVVKNIMSNLGITKKEILENALYLLRPNPVIEYCKNYSEKVANATIKDTNMESIMKEFYYSIIEPIKEFIVKKGNLKENLLDENVEISTYFQPIHLQHLSEKPEQQ